MIADAQLSRVLDGRQVWYERKLEQVAAAPSATWVELSLNIPGWPKQTAWTECVFTEGRRRLIAGLAARPAIQLSSDAGHFGLFQSPLSPREAKLRAVELERAHSWGRLWDIDCRGPDGPVTRRSLGIPQRSCLVCSRPHEACIGAGRHSLSDVRCRAEVIADQVPMVGQRSSQ